MRNSDYWKQRFTQLEAAQNAAGKEAAKSIERLYRTAQKELESKIAVWYQRFADNNAISMQEARKWLTSKELEEFKWDVSEYIKKGEENAAAGQWQKKLENASGRFHISRLEALRITLEQSLQELYTKEENVISSTMADVYEESYCRTMFELQQGLNIGFDVAKPDNAFIRSVLSKPWAADGYNFSERLWKQKTQLINTIHREISVNILTGADPQKAIDRIARKMNTSRYNAGRLVMTEEAYFSSLAQGECYRSFEVEKFQILATLDDRTSDICQSMDGKVFAMSEYKAGVTAPPFHVYCRSTTVPYFDDELGVPGKRAARDKDGNTFYVPADMNYQEWKRTFVKDGSESVDNSGGSGIIKDEITYRTTESGKIIATRSVLGNYCVKLPDGNSSYITNPVFDKYEVFAGKGSEKELRVRDFLADNYGGTSNNWFHAKGYVQINDSDGIMRNANVHWFEEENVGIRELKVKGWSKK